MSDPQEAATPSDPHSAEAEEREAWAAFVAGHASRDAEVAELRAERDGLLRLREVAHWECDCVPDLGPTHCHACSDAAGHPVEWADSTHGPSAEVAELKAKIAAAVARLNAASIPPMMTEAQFNATTITDARRILLGSASSPVEGGN